MKRNVLIPLLAALLGPAGVAAQEEELGIARGTTPPPVVIEDLDGNPVDLADYIGRRPVLIEFWATWCPLCEALEPQLRAAQAAYGSRMDFLAVAVAVNQSRNAIRRHLERHPLPFPLLYDTRGRATRAFQAPSTSYIVALDASGTVVYTGLGDAQDIQAAVRRALGDR